jgi:hypothetical protein
MKQKMPDGWVHVEWKDNIGQKWFSNIPDTLVPQFKSKVIESGGSIIKVVR